MEDVRALCHRIREIGFSIHVYLGHGYVEKVYENALAHRLSKAGILIQRQSPIRVKDEDGTIIGELVPDMLIERVLLVEIKAVHSLVAEHQAQMLGYLKATGMEHGLLINFGAYRFQAKKYVRTRHVHEAATNG
ncbi:MAG TPA: GxxExxY protein [Steroidobacteraceae bacterium]|nr:GxxExxY protein [Steroidobacteraceae bacterium]